MNPHHVLLIEQAWAQLAPNAEFVGMAFYDRLFALDPRLRRLFRGERSEQAKKLMQMLAAAIGLLRRPEQLLPVLEQLGRRHAGYGVVDAHYALVGQALLQTLEAGLGADFTPAQREAWTALYAVVSGTMQRAAALPAAA
jgi:hemoglobin-like flavoprotein